MDKKYSMLLLMLILATGFAGAQTLYRYGFCGGRVATEGKMTIEGAAFVEAAIHLTAEELSRFSGDSFAGVNAGLVSKLNVHSLTVWLREAPGGENLAEKTIDIRSAQKPRDGWNNVKFETPVGIQPGTDYYVGFTIEQTKTSSALAFVEGDHAGASWVRQGEGEWIDRADAGVLCIEALISGDNLPKNDMSLLSAKFSDSYYVASKPISLTYEISNKGIEPVTSYVLSVKADGTDMVESRTIYQNINYGVTRSYMESFTFEGLEPGRTYDFTVSVCNANGMADETAEDNSLTIAGIPVVGHTYARTVLLEEFTTEGCSNCPAAAETVHDMIETMTEDDRARFAMACHHSAFGTDPFTQPCDQEYTWFFNNNGATYAPAFMLDRVRESGSAIATPVFTNLPVEAFAYKVAQARNVAALYSISLEGTREESKREVAVKVKGSTVLPVFDTPRVTVYLVEDSVLASRDGRGQKGSGGKIYYHNHLLRAYNSTWGEAPEWDGSDYSYECTLSYPEECNPDHMQVIAFISNYDETSAINCEIGNVAWRPMCDLEVAGVALNQASEKGVGQQIFDLSGRLVDSTGETSGLQPGIYIRTSATLDGRKSEKILVR